MPKSRRVSRLNYAFAVGKIRALERFLIREEVFRQAIESDLAEALRLFTESDLYSDELLHIKDSRQLEDILNRESAALKKMMSFLLLDKGLLGLLELKSIRCAEEALRGYRSDFLSDYVRHLIDTHNIKTFLRLYFLKEPKKKLKDFLTCEGFIKKEDFLELYASDLSRFLNRLEYVRKPNSAIINYSGFLKEAIQKIETERSFIYLEKAINDFLVHILRPAKYLNLGPEPLIAYYFAKVNEINLTRMIILSKLNHVSAEIVKERLNSVYA